MMHEKHVVINYMRHIVLVGSVIREGIDHLQHNDEINNLLLQKVSSIYIQ